MVLKTAFSIPNFSLMILTRGAIQLVVQEALEKICLLPSNSLTEMTLVETSCSPSDLAGAESSTFLAPPTKWALAFLGLLN